jgi:hypothetical protein
MLIFREILMVRAGKGTKGRKPLYLTYLSRKKKNRGVEGGEIGGKRVGTGNKKEGEKGDVYKGFRALRALCCPPALTKIVTSVENYREEPYVR